MDERTVVSIEPILARRVFSVPAMPVTVTGLDVSFHWMQEVAP